MKYTQPPNAPQASHLDELKRLIEAGLWQPREDLFGISWPDSLPDFLNLRFHTDAALLTAYKARNPNWRDLIPWAEPKIGRRLRHEQKHVRALVDSLLESGDPEQVAKKLNLELRRIRVTPELCLRSQLGLGVGPSDSPFAFRLHGLPQPLSDAQQALVDLARLYDSGHWRSLRKCPECGTYFLAGGRRRKKYCGRRCMWKAAQDRHRRGETEADRVRRRTEDRKRYRRRTGREAGFAPSG
jgi:hypothetical protein